MDFSLLRYHNPRLFYDGVCRRKIPYSAMFGTLQTGTAVTNSFVEGIVGGPKPPEYSSYDPLTTDIIGPGTGYPKPWRSFSQYTQNGTYGSLIGPYARIVKLPDVDNLLFPNTCIDSDGDGVKDKPKSCGGGTPGTGIYGRLGIGDGQYLGFRSQDWYHQNEGSYGTDYYNSQLGVEWLTWKKWWDGASKKTITVRWINEVYGDPLVDVEVAYSHPEVGDEEYYPGFNLSSFADSSYELLTLMVGAAVFSRWLF